MARSRHASPPTDSSPALLETLVGDNRAERQRWFQLIAASLDPDTLRRLEAQALRLIDERYPDDPGSLFNSRYREGQRLKRELQAGFDRAHRQLIEQQLSGLEGIRGLFVTHTEAMVADLLYAERRPAARRRRQDHLADVSAAGLAHDHDYQRAQAEAEAAHRREVDLRVVTAALDRQRLELVAELERLQRRLDQPHEIALKTYAVLESMAKYQMSLQDRAQRNPALADRLRMVGLGLTSVMASVQSLIAQLNAQGTESPTSEEVRAQTDRILALMMEQLTQWQEQIHTEPL